RLIREAAVGSICALLGVSIIAGVMAYRQRDRALVEAATAERTSRFMVSLFQLASPTESRGNSVTVREVLDRGAREINQSLQQEPRVRAELLTAMGEAYMGLGLYDPAKQALGRAEADQHSVGTPAESRVRTLIASGEAAYLTDDLGLAKTKLNQALTVARRDLPRDSVLISEARDALADVLVDLKEYPEAERLAADALAMDRKRGVDGTPILARTLGTIGNAYYFRGDLKAAEAPMREALLLWRQYYGLNHPRTAESMNNLASLLYQEGRYGEAARQWTEALPVYRVVYGEAHPELATLLNNLGRSELMAGHVDAAIPLARSALEMGQTLKGATHGDLVPPLNSLAMAYLYKGDAATAYDYAERALKIARLRNHSILDQVMLTAADVDLALGREQQAAALLGESRRLLESRYPLGKDPAERWRYAVWDAIQVRLETESSAAHARLVQDREVLTQRFGSDGFYVLRATQQMAALPVSSTTPSGGH
ncbi:MAG: tetratricopeptide repeat protein, partial [Gammaproteobacteria bacterium]|nr:tetratricopeptide repeat protein [Gammaproteobacteria bacterium]